METQYMSAVGNVNLIVIVEMLSCFTVFIVNLVSRIVGRRITVWATSEVKPELYLGCVSIHLVCTEMPCVLVYT